MSTRNLLSLRESRSAGKYLVANLARIKAEGLTTTQLARELTRELGFQVTRSNLYLLFDAFDLPWHFQSRNPLGRAAKGTGKTHRLGHLESKIAHLEAGQGHLAINHGASSGGIAQRIKALEADLRIIRERADALDDSRKDSIDACRKLREVIGQINMRLTQMDDRPDAGLEDVRKRLSHLEKLPGFNLPERVSDLERSLRGHANTTATILESLRAAEAQAVVLRAMVNQLYRKLPHIRPPEGAIVDHDPRTIAVGGDKRKA